MRDGTIYISRVDRKRIQAFLKSAPSSKSADRQGARDLEDELDRAEVVEPEQVPADIITMNSRVQLTDIDQGKTFEYTLVFPPEADYAAGKISILAPIGTALLGYRVGDEIHWTVPDGVRRLRVDALLYQPEAAGDFHR